MLFYSFKFYKHIQTQSHTVYCFRYTLIVYGRNIFNVYRILLNQMKTEAKNNTKIVVKNKNINNCFCCWCYSTQKRRNNKKECAVCSWRATLFTALLCHDSRWHCIPSFFSTFFSHEMCFYTYFLYRRTIWDKLTFMPTARLFSNFTPSILLLDNQPNKKIYIFSPVFETDINVAVCRE